MKLIYRFTGSLLIATLSFTPLAGLAAEGKKGLNAVNVKVTRQAGDPIPDIDITTDRVPEEKERGSQAYDAVRDTPNGDKVMRLLKKRLPGVIGGDDDDSDPAPKR